MRPGTKRALIAILAVLAVAGALFFAAREALRALEGDALRERARVAAEEGLTRALAEIGIEAKVTIGALEGPLLPRPVLRDVRVAAEGATPLQIDRLSARVDLAALFARRAILDDVRAEGLALVLTRDEGSPDVAPRWTWERIGREPPPAGEPAWWDAFVPTRLVFREITIPGARVALRFTQDGAPSALELRVDGSLAGWSIPVGAASTPGEPVPWPETARLALEASPGSVAGRRLERATARLALDGPTLRLEEATLESAFGRARLTGETDVVRWLGDDTVGEIAVDGTLSDLDLGLLLDRPAWAGALDLKGTLALARPPGASLAASHASADLVLGPSRIGGLRLDGGRLVGRSDTGRYTLDEARLEGAFGSIRAKGAGSRERIGSLALDAELRDLAALDALAPLVERPPFGLAGSATLHAALRGEWSRPAGSAELETQGLRAAGLELGRLRLRAESPDGTRLVLAPFLVQDGAIGVEALEPVRLRREGDGLRVEALRLRGPKGAVASLAGWIDASAVKDLRVELPDLALAPFAPLLGPGRSLGGSASLRLVANGPLPRPAVSGDFVWTRPQLDEFSAERVEASVATERGVAQARAVLRGAGRELLQATATLPWRPGVDPLESIRRGDATLHVSGEAVDLALFDRVVGEGIRRLEGRADLRLDVRGSASGAVVDGSLRILGAHFDVLALGQRLGPLDARLAIGNDAIRIEEATLLGADSGRVTLSGDVALEGLRPGRAALRLVADDFLVRHRTSLRFKLDADVALAGPVGALYAHGDARLEDLHFYLRPGGDPLLAEIAVIEPGGTPHLARRHIVARTDDTGGLLAGASADVRIVIPKDSWVVGQGANVEIAGDLRAAKAPQGPLGLYGAITTLRGDYRAQGRIFTIAPSRVVFDGRPDADPLLDVRAEGSAGGAEIFVRVQGRASSPAIRLTSNPPYPERDILALLLFGRTRDQLGKSEAGALQSFLAQTGGGAAIESLNAFLGPTLHVDTIESTPSERGEGGTVGIGRWLTKDIFVQYGQGYGDAAGSEVRVNWKLYPRWSLESRYSSEQGSSADVIWNYDY